jgi:hypothetical protein
MEFGALAIGLAMLAVSLVSFVVLLPRGVRVSPLLGSDSSQAMLMMALVTLFFVGAALVLFGFPAPLSSGR